MKLINNQYFISLDQHLDLKKLDSYEEEMCLGFAKSEKYIYLSSTPTRSLLNSSEQIAFQDIKNTASQQYPNLNKKELEWYSLIKGGETHGYVLFLRNIKNYPGDFAFKSKSSYCINTSAAENFKFLFDWIDEQKCFKEYGRVLFFVSLPGQSGMIHKDNVGVELIEDSYIWITGNKFPKSIFLYNETNKQKIYANSRAVFFNNQNYHGTENNNTCASWSLRIDGIFDDNWLKSLELNNHSKKSHE
jgi:hypothetical protein